MYFDNKWIRKNPLLNPLSDDWFIWSPQDHNFLFCIRQAIELSLKQLCEIKGIIIKENHDLVDRYKKINELYNWNNYGIVEEKFVNALKFMQDKNEIFRYPYDKKKNNYETVAIHLSDWLFLVHALYYIITEEQERNGTNA